MYSHFEKIKMAVFPFLSIFDLSSHIINKCALSNKIDCSCIIIFCL